MGKIIATLLEIITFFTIGFLLVSIHQGSFDIEQWDMTKGGYTVFGSAFWIGLIYYMFIKE